MMADPAVRRRRPEWAAPDRTVRRVRVDRCHRAGAHHPGQGRRVADPDHRRHVGGFDHVDQQIRIRRRVERTQCGARPVSGCGPGGVRGRLSGRGNHHHPARCDPRSDHRRRSVGVRGDRVGGRRRPAAAGLRRGSAELRQRAGVSSGRSAAQRATAWDPSGWSSTTTGRACFGPFCRSAGRRAGSSPN